MNYHRTEEDDCSFLSDLSTQVVSLYSHVFSTECQIHVNYLMILAN